MTRPPIIGLSTYLEPAAMGIWDRPAAVLPRVYIDAVLRAGGVPVALPPQPTSPEAIAAVLEVIDALVIIGGKDVDAALYGQDAHPENDAPRPDRDAWEIALVQGAIAQDLPLLGICRGLQVLVVALGGTLVQHLPDLIGSSRYSNGDATFADNPVLIEAGSLVAGMFGASATVKSYHHQAADRVPPGLAITARGDDGVVQAVEVLGMRFGVAVQWHPEESSEDSRLLSGLVAATRVGGA